MIVTLEGIQGCHRAGQGILMYSGEVKLVEKIVVGDQLMGPDSAPRTVLDLRRGIGSMVKVRPNKGEPFVVNEDHILTLEWSPRRTWDRKTGKRFDVSVRDYPGLSNNEKQHMLLVRVAVDFTPGEELPLDPYFVGSILGDGLLTTSCVGLSGGERKKEVVAAFCGGLGIRKTKGNYHYNPIFGLNPIRGEDRFVPQVYKVASRENRLKLLAGLLDTDGSLNGTGFCELTSKSRKLAEDLAFVARSVGLAAYVKQRDVRTHFGDIDYTGTYWRVGVSGELGMIPFKRLRPAKRAGGAKNVLRTGFKLVPTGTREPYFGFVLDGDGRYLQSDMTVGHNSGKSLSAVAMLYMDKQRGRQILSNNHLNDQLFGKYTFFDTKFFVEHLMDAELEQASLLLDEAYVYMDARTGQGKLNKLFTYFTVQTRKRGVDMYVCTHHIDVLDKRLRRAVDVRGTCRYMAEDPCRRCRGTGALKRRGARKKVLALAGGGGYELEGQREEGGVLDEMLDEDQGDRFGEFGDGGNGTISLDGKWERCPRCLGFGKTGWAVTDFLQQRTGRRSRLKLLGPAFWGLYDTHEKIPPTAMQRRIDVRDL